MTNPATNPVDPETGAPLHRDVRPFTLTYKGESITFDMPGWCGDHPDEGVFDPDDMKVFRPCVESAQGLHGRIAAAGPVLSGFDLRTLWESADDSTK